MNKVYIFIFSVLVLAGVCCSYSYADIALEPFTYSEDFESGELNAWASYPLWQDTAFDPNFRVNAIIHGDANLSIEQKVTPYTNVDNYAGAQKKLDMYLVPGSTIRLRYYLKAHLPFAWFKVRVAAGSDGKVDYTIKSPPLNRWEWVTVTYDDFVRQNPRIAGKDRIKVNALAVLAKLPNADPTMPFYFGLDDIVFTGTREAAFQFAEPAMHKLSEWKSYIPANHYQKGDTFTLKGQWPFKVNRVVLAITPFMDRSKIVRKTNLKKKGNEWSASFRLTFPEGLYHAVLSAYNRKEKGSTTEFTFYIAPKGIGGTHPRISYNAESRKWIIARLKSERFKNVAEELSARAEKFRQDVPLDIVVFDFDQFYGGDANIVWGGTHAPWRERLYSFCDAVYENALVYSLLGDNEAGEYAKNVLVKVSAFPYWSHPWWLDRGRHIYLSNVYSGTKFGNGYDLLYDLMDATERKLARGALMKNQVIAFYKGYVEDNLVTNNTSNWVAFLAAGALVCQAAIYGDGPDVAPIEPYFTGIILKWHDFTRKSIGRDRAYGEGAGHYYYSVPSVGMWSHQVMDTFFHIDLFQTLDGSYEGLIWDGIIKKKLLFDFGDSGRSIGSPVGTSWLSWLVDKNKDPLLGWFYNYLREENTLQDVFYETEDVPQKDPFDENPVRLFRDVGRTVFKSGWEPDDFVFVMHTGPFYNHQHLDQGTFWLADRGSIFIEERHGSSYYDCQLYQPWYTQPVAHSTILINGNHQSQRVGDPLHFAGGFHDHGFVYHFLDGTNAAFCSGDIGRVYWGEVKDMKRNVLYLKPRTLIMLDTVIPAERDVDITLLYQTTYLKDINPGIPASTITKDNNVLHIIHLAPEKPDVDAVETPHYLLTLRNERPLIREGMLTVTSRTDEIPLIMANILTTTTGSKPDVVTEKGDGYISGTVSGTPFAFTTRLNSVYETGGIKTDALALTWNDDCLYAALCTLLERNDLLIFASDEPVTCEISKKRIKYYLAQDSKVFLGVLLKPSSITVNGKKSTDFLYDAKRNAIVIKLSAGEGMVEF